MLRYVYSYQSILFIYLLIQKQHTVIQLTKADQNNLINDKINQQFNINDYNVHFIKFQWITQNKSQFIY